jgi:hypothetical protein
MGVRLRHQHRYIVDGIDDQELRRLIYTHTRQRYSRSHIYQLIMRESSLSGRQLLKEAISQTEQYLADLNILFDKDLASCVGQDATECNSQDHSSSMSELEPKQPT